MLGSCCIIKALLVAVDVDVLKSEWRGIWVGTGCVFPRAQQKEEAKEEHVGDGEMFAGALQLTDGDSMRDDGEWYWLDPCGWVIFL
jgi:hypothetical protein